MSLTSEATNTVADSTLMTGEQNVTRFPYEIARLAEDIAGIPGQK